MIPIGFGLSNLGSGPSLLIILVIVLLLFGAKRLPELARGLGQAIREFDKAKNGLTKTEEQSKEPDAEAKAPEEPPKA